MTARTRTSLLALAASLSLSLSLSLAAGEASAEVERRGSWPDEDPNVSLDARGISRAEAVRRLADAARWSVVLHAPPGDPVDLRVTDQPASKVLDMLLADGRYVATRDGSMVAVTRAQAHDEAPSPAVPPASPAAPAAPAVPPASPASPAQPAQPSSGVQAQGGDRKVVGQSLTIARGEVVHDVTVRGGSLKIRGTVTGDVDVAGGSVELYEGARVAGKVRVAGGSLHIGNNASVDGDVSVTGGSVHRAESAKVGGAVESRGGNAVSVMLDEVDHQRSDEHEPPSRLAAAAKAVGDAVTKGALLFVLGTVLLALAPRRLEALRASIATRPMRAFALGLVGSVVLVALLVALCVSVLGIPVAILGALLTPVALFSGLAAAASVAGEALLRHRTENPYVHLGAGCALLTLAGLLPYAGSWVTTVAGLIGLGSVFATRAAGLLGRGRGRLDEGGYRDAAL